MADVQPTIKPSGKALDEWFRSIQPGDRLVRGRNTLYDANRPDGYTVGEVLVVKKAGRYRIETTGWAASGGVYIQPPRRVGVYIRPPRRVSDVVAISDDGITYKIRDGHTTTWFKAICQSQGCICSPSMPCDEDLCDGQQTFDGNSVRCTMCLNDEAAMIEEGA
jgi:hypothetical protein